MNKLLPKIAPKGFTLVELLVVVSIIAILAVVGVTVFNGVQSRARDARRQSDVQSIAKALESNKVSGSTSYPQIQASWFGGTVPAEAADSVPKYSIVYTTAPATLPVGKPIAWGTTETPAANPSAPAGSVVATVGPNIPPTGTTMYTFQVCALLENGTFPSIFCVPSSQ